ncbi:ABC-F family ATP-binding cassette domain-containing protein [Chloroflexia bacterium SDU3-3]|nr:ABC-F family ATP-binding cassette domain-containing protein [Chloroflexia bacterium SDU3-3]
MTILTLEAITKQFDERPLLRGIDLGVAQGERVGLVGVNGSGKTTLLRIAARVEQPDTGRVSVARDMRVAYLPQNPVMDPERTALEQIFQGDSEAMQVLRAYEQASAALAASPADAALQQRVADLVGRMDAAGAWQIEQDARTILSKLGIADLSAPVGTLSGGQRRRVAMAQTLISPADLLILDEPTNHIDTETIAWLEGFLSRATFALLLVTHDRYFLERVVNRIVEVDMGKLYSYPGNYARFLEMKEARAVAQASEEARRQTILRKEIAWLRQGAQARTTKQQARIDRIADMQAVERDPQRGELEISVESRRLGKRVIEVKQISKAMGGRALIRDLSLSVGRRDRIGIVGPNGQGKTTLLNMIAGRLEPDAGAVEVGETVHMVYYDQESAGLDPSQRVIDYVKEGAELQRTGEGALITASQMLQRFLFPPNTHYSLIGKLSGGERRRLYLLRKLIEAPNVLLLDEPTNDLDIQTLSVLEDYLDEFAGALITVSHDRYFLDRTAERLLVFEQGAVNEYPGGYSAYEARRAAREAEAAQAKPTPKPAQAAQAPAAKSRRLSFKEQRELKELEERIPQLEAEQEQIQAALAAAPGHAELTRLSSELERSAHELEAAFERWAALAERAEG